MIRLDAKAESARSGIQQIRSSQQAQGLDMRGDILASLSRMNSYINEANNALSRTISMLQTPTWTGLKKKSQPSIHF